MLEIFHGARNITNSFIMMMMMRMMMVVVVDVEDGKSDWRDLFLNDGNDVNTDTINDDCHIEDFQ